MFYDTPFPGKQGKTELDITLFIHFCLSIFIQICKKILSFLSSWALSFMTYASYKLNMKSLCSNIIALEMHVSNTQSREPYINHPVAVALPQVVQHRRLIQMGQHSHVLNHVKFGRVHWLHVIFFYSHGLQRQIEYSRSRKHLESQSVPLLRGKCIISLGGDLPTQCGVSNSICFHRHKQKQGKLRCYR